MRLSFEALCNVRDLGGMPAAGGRKIRSGMLYRSGFLLPATENDIKKLGMLGLSAIIDFRSEREQEEKPDPEIAGAKHICLPVIADLIAGLTREQRADEQLMRMLTKQFATPEESAAYMRKTYQIVAGHPYSVSQYARFLHMLSEERGAVLWHCTAGKDRAGFASVLVEEILGVPREVIYEDYLYTNECMRGDRHVLADRGRNAITERLLSAEREYLDAAYECMGDVGEYLVDKLGISPEMQASMREKFLA